MLITDFPSDIIFEICSYLPPLSLIRFASSCRPLWNLRSTAYDNSYVGSYEELVSRSKFTEGIYLAIWNEDLEGVEFFLKKRSSCEEQTSKKNMNKNIYYAAQIGRRDMVDLLIRYDDESWYHGFLGAARGGHIHLLDYFTNIYQPHFSNCEKPVWEDALYEASAGGHIHIVKYCIEKDSAHLQRGLYSARHRPCEDAVFIAANSGHYNVAKFLLSLAPSPDVTSLNHCMISAAGNLDKDTVEYFVQLGANNWNDALINCVRQELTPQRLELIEYFIAKGANDWNTAFRASMEAKSEQLMELFLKKGADCLDQCIKAAKEGKNSDSDDEIFSYGFDYAELCDFKRRYEAKRRKME